MEDQITEQEIPRTLCNLKDNKPLGLDGLTSEFYKTFSKELTPHLNGMFWQCLMSEKKFHSLGMKQKANKPEKDHIHKLSLVDQSPY